MKVRNFFQNLYSINRKFRSLPMHFRLDIVLHAWKCFRLFIYITCYVLPYQQFSPFSFWFFEFQKQQVPIRDRTFNTPPPKKKSIFPSLCECACVQLARALEELEQRRMAQDVLVKKARELELRRGRKRAAEEEQHRKKLDIANLRLVRNFLSHFFSCWKRGGSPPFSPRFLW